MTHPNGAKAKQEDKFSAGRHGLMIICADWLIEIWPTTQKAIARVKETK